MLYNLIAYRIKGLMIGNFSAMANVIRLKAAKSAGTVKKFGSRPGGTLIAGLPAIGAEQALAAVALRQEAEKR